MDLSLVLAGEDKPDWICPTELLQGGGTNPTGSVPPSSTVSHRAAPAGANLVVDLQESSCPSVVDLQESSCPSVVDLFLSSMWTSAGGEGRSDAFSPPTTTYASWSHLPHYLSMYPPTVSLTYRTYDGPTNSQSLAEDPLSFQCSKTNQPCRDRSKF